MIGRGLGYINRVLATYGSIGQIVGDTVLGVGEVKTGKGRKLE